MNDYDSMQMLLVGLIVVIVIIAISCSYANQSQARNYNGKYKSIDPNACPIEIKITKNAYVFKFNDKIRKTI